MKKLIALGLAGVMTLSSGLAALAANPEPTLSPSPAASVVAGTTGNNKTDFYLRVADADDGETPSVDVTATARDGEKVYSVQYEDSSTSNFSITVPLYVAMYGYGQSGNVLTPDGETYKIQNSSTSTTTTKVKEVDEFIQVYDAMTDMPNVQFSYKVAGEDVFITSDEELANSQASSLTVPYGENQTQNLAAIQAMLANGDKYYYYTSETGIVSVPAAYAVTVDNQTGRFFKVANLSSSKVKTSYAVNVSTTAGTASTVGSTPQNNVESLGSGDTTYTIGAAFGESGTKDIQVKINKVAAATADNWTLVSGTPQNSKEIYMTINGLDLSTATGEGAVTDGSNWIVAKGTTTTSNNQLTTVPGEKGLPVSAAIAKDMNDFANTQVVSVTYTVETYEGA